MISSHLIQYKILNSYGGSKFFFHPYSRYADYMIETNLQCFKNENEKKHSVCPTGSQFNVSVVQFLFPLQKQTFENT